MRLIDADALKEKILAERDAIPLTFVERYGFGVPQQNYHATAMRGGIRKALRCMEQTPTIDPESLRPTGEWIRLDAHKGEEGFKCSVCRSEAYVPTCMGKPMYAYCPNCGCAMMGVTP